MLTFDPHHFECVTTQKALTKWVKRIEGAKSFCIDTETTGLDTFTDSLVGVALAVEDGTTIQSCYIPVAHHQGTQLDVGTVLTALAPALRNERIGKVFHNALFDLAMFSQPRYDVRIENVHDTMWMQYVLSGDQLPLGMDFLAKKHFGWNTIKFGDVVTNRPGRTDFRDVPLDEATNYAAEDTGITLALAHALQYRLKQFGLWEVYTRDRKLIPVLHAMKQAGVMVDTALLGKLDAEWSKECEELQATAHAVAGEDFNLGSSQQVIRVLEARGLEIPIDNKTGNKSADKYALEQLAGDELVDVLSEYRQVSKLLSTYARALPLKVKEHSGRVHPNFNATRTSTGRLSSTDPNFQNLSRRSERGLEIRKAIVAPKGMLLVGADFSQIELRVAAALSGDPVLLKAYNDGIDVHKLTAATIGRKAVEEVTPAERDVAKTANFLALYQGGARQLARVAKIDPAEAYSFLFDYWEGLSVLKEYVEKCKEFGREHLYVETMFGRRIHVPAMRSKDSEKKGHAERLCVSGAIQGTAADICREAMVAVHRVLPPRSRMLIQCHDELIIECPDYDAEAVKNIVKEEMETCCKIGVAIVVDAKIGQSWSALK